LPSAAELTGAVGGGLTRRVPGAQRPDVPLAPLGGADRSGADEAPRSSPDDVYSFLSSFQSGVDRGRAEANGGDADSASDESDPEEGVR
ncbi:MAG TPA: hypothetical protein VIR30_06625, partial [Nocardioides sp.]